MRSTKPILLGSFQQQICISLGDRDLGAIPSEGTKIPRLDSAESNVIENKQKLT
jgi:hypothetical protein